MTQMVRLAQVGLVLLLAEPSFAWSQIENDPAKLAKPRREFTQKELDRREAQKLFGVAGLHEKANRLIEAVRTYEKAEKLDPESAAIPRALFGLYLALDRTPDALASCKKILKLDPDDCQTAYLYSRQLRAMERRSEAIEVLQSATKSNRLGERADLAAQIWFDLGVTYEEEKQWSKAEKAFREVVAILDHSGNLSTDGKYTREEIISQTAETLERIGRLCLKGNQVAEAIKAFEAAKVKDPSRKPRLAYHLAQVYRSQNKPREALEQLEIYLRGQPQGIEAYEMKIELQRRIGRSADVLPSLESASNRDPNNVQLRLLFAKELTAARRYAQAHAIYQNLLEIHVTADVYRGLFNLLRLRGDAGIGEIIHRLNQALASATGDEDKNVAPNNADARRARAMLQVLREDPALVRQILPLAVARSGKKQLHYTTRGILATLASRTKLLAEAEQLYRSCLYLPQSGGPNEAEVYYGLLRVLRLQHKHADTIKICTQGLRVAHQTNRLMFHTELVRAYLAINDFKSALEAADIAVTESSKSSLLTCKRIRIDALVQAGQKEKALAECQELLKEFNSGSELRDVRYALSSVYNALNRPEEAEEQLLLILQTDPNDATANNDLGYYWADRNKNLDVAERMIRKAIELDKQQRNGGSSIDADADKENAAYVDSLGWVLFRKGKLEEARQELEKASTLPQGEDDPVVWDHLGDTYYKLKLTTKAVEAWKKAIVLFEQGTRRKSDGRFREIQEKLRRATTP